ncbi:unnamed protein product, partial [Staurois parvus]
SVLPSSATCQCCPAVPHQCHLSVSISALCQCPSVPHQCHISVPICLSVSPISASQCHPLMPISATYQRCQSVPPISASQCRLSVPVSVAYQCQSVLPVSA